MGSLTIRSRIFLASASSSWYRRGSYRQVPRSGPANFIAKAQIANLKIGSRHAMTARRSRSKSPHPSDLVLFAPCLRSGLSWPNHVCTWSQESDMSDIECGMLCLVLGWAWSPLLEGIMPSLLMKYVQGYETDRVDVLLSRHSHRKTIITHTSWDFMRLSREDACLAG